MSVGISIKESIFIDSFKDVNLIHRKLRALPTFAVIGRSNVGKSTFINTLLNSKTLAKTGKTPGRTRMANYFMVNGKYYCVDLPGYGYAQLSKSGRDELRQLIQDFLQHAPELKLVVQLTDMRVGATEDDVFYFRNIYQSGLPVLLIANKSDKVSASKQKSVLEKIARDVGVDELPTPFSSVTKHTLSRVRQILFSELDP